jgi:hypothetical protein
MTKPLGRSFDTPAGRLAEAAWFDPATRPAVCGICGATFTQRRLSDRFRDMARGKARRIGQAAAIDRVIPDGFVPLFCNPCEHRVLSHEESADLPAPDHTPMIDLTYERDERAALADT